MLREAKAKKDEAEAKAVKEKIESDKRDAEKKAELLEKREVKSENADSKKFLRRAKAVKK